ncbi:MAG: hypothetical protein ACR2M0_14700 [Chloroflexia bacterium]
MTPKLYTALKWGALLGGPLAIFETFGYLMALNAGSIDVYDATNTLGNLLEIAVPVAAGWLAVRATGERRSGLIAGLTVGVIVAAVNMVTELVVPGSALSTLSGQPPVSGGDLIVSILTTRALTLGLGAWGGWLGGRLQSIAKPPTQPPRP